MTEGRRLMFSFKMRQIIGLLSVIVLIGSISDAQAALPDPTLDAPMAQSQDTSIVLAGGCFWGMQAVFQHLKGVKIAVSGYAGGSADTAHYDTVSNGGTGHAESVEVTYDPGQITLGEILKVYFSVAHDPTELNYQGPDHGTQYRSEIFYSTPEQQKIAEAYIKQLETAKAFSSPIVTKVEPLKGFYAAEDYHQDYAKRHPYNPYIMINDAPKVSALEKEFPQLYLK
jgi:peptide-methionine (S)-S-oxide reductase